MSHTLLIVEDDPYVVRLYQRLFRLEKFQVTVAVDGSDGIKKAKTLKPALILMDIMMPIINGLEALKQLKADEATKDIPIIMLTNVGEEAIIELAYSLGAIGYMVKSEFTPQEVLERVRPYLTAEKQVGGE